MNILPLQIFEGIKAEILLQLKTYHTNNTLTELDLANAQKTLVEKGCSLTETSHRS